MINNIVKLSERKVKNQYQNDNYLVHKIKDKEILLNKIIWKDS